MKAKMFASLIAALVLMHAEQIPVEITNTSPTTHTLRNRSGKPIAGYVIKVEFTDSSGSSARVSETRLRGFEPNGAKGFQPGEVWVHKSRRAFPADSVKNTVIDYVLFEDGSGWGPNTTGQKEALIGVRDGWRAAHARLRRLLQEGGTDSVVEYLRRTTP